MTPDEIPNPNAVGIRTTLNGCSMQDWNTNDMINDVLMLIDFLNGSRSLAYGAVSRTDTPHDVVGACRSAVFMQHRYRVTVEKVRIGVLTNRFVAAEVAA